MKSLILALGISACATLASAVPIEGTVEFLTEDTTGWITIKGTGGTIKGDTDKELIVDLATFDTKDKLRNEHMREKYLETAKFPTATLKLDAPKPGAKFAWSGLLTIKGQTKPVKGTATLVGSDLWAEFAIKLADFPAIGEPAWKDAKISLVQDVTITVRAKTK